MKSVKVNSGDDLMPADHNNLVDDARAAAALLPHEQSSPDLTVYVEPGVYYLAGTQVEFAGGNSPTFTAPAANPRIDLLTINTSGVLERTAGTENASPVAPAAPAGKFVIAQIYNRVGQTTIRDTSVAGQGYIYKDLRLFLADGYIQDASQIANGVITAAKLAQTYVQTTGDETIAGKKTFSTIPELPASNPTTGNQAVRKDYADSLLTQVAVVPSINLVTDLSNSDLTAWINNHAGTPVMKLLSSYMNNAIYEKPLTRYWGDAFNLGASSSLSDNPLPHEQNNYYMYGVARIGSNYYTSYYDWGNWRFYTNGTTAMNFSGSGNYGPMATDGTYLFILDQSGGVSVKKYSISGTTATYIATITLANRISAAGSPGRFVYCNGFFYGVDYSDSKIIRKFDASTGALVASFTLADSFIGVLCDINNHVYNATIEGSTSNKWIKFHKID